MLRISDDPKHFEELLLILFADANTSVLHRDLDQFVFILLLYLNLDESFLCKLESVRQKVEAYLLYPFLVAADHVVTCWETDEF